MKTASHVPGADNRRSIGQSIDRMSMTCTRCGACCVAPDIAALDKPLGMRCPHLTADNLCGIYDRRPQICRDYAADEVCRLIEAPTLEERVQKYLALFGLEEEARGNLASGCASMRAARQRTVSSGSRVSGGAAAGSSAGVADAFFFGKMR